MLITFSGLDGAGKSTLIKRLKERLEERDQQVAVFHMNYDVGVQAYARLALRGVAAACGRRSTPEAWRSHAPRRRAWRGRRRSAAARLRHAVFWNKTLRLCVYPLDLVIFLCCRFYIESMTQRVLIMDRYFYDTLVDVSGGRRGFGVRLLSWLTPTPCVPVYLDISPEEAYARKGEHSVAYLRRRRRLYQEVFPRVPCSVVLAAGRDVGATLRALESVVGERMHAR